MVTSLIHKTRGIKIHSFIGGVAEDSFSVVLCLLMLDFDGVVQSSIDTVSAICLFVCLELTRQGTVVCLAYVCATGVILCVCVTGCYSSLTSCGFWSPGQSAGTKYFRLHTRYEQLE